MASNISCSVKFKKFKWNRNGYREVLNRSATQSLVSSPASKVLRSVGAEYEMKQWEGKLAKGYLVRTATAKGRYSEAKTNALSKALRSV